MHSVERKTAVIGDTKLSYLESGSHHKAVALFIHGIPASAELWRETLAITSVRGWHSIAPDLPGYGQTRLPAGGDYAIAGAARLLIQWLELAGHQDIWLIAHDIGGGVAQIMMTQATALFSRVTFSNVITADTWPVSSIAMLIWIAKRGLFKHMAGVGLFPNFIANKQLRRAVHDPDCLTRDRVSRIFWDGKATDKQGRIEFQRMLSALTPEDTMRNMEALRRVNLPVHLVWGMQDPNQPWDGPGRILRETFPTAKITQLPHAGHFLQIDSPGEYVDAICVPTSEGS
ncbi:MAG: alpha/beta hydrolase [Myxococcota bacterium]|nr:alpha/beta hydrolase [Myxococcota bacterium]